MLLEISGKKSFKVGGRHCKIVKKVEKHPHLTKPRIGLMASLTSSPISMCFYIGKCKLSGHKHKQYEKNIIKLG